MDVLPAWCENTLAQEIKKFELRRWSSEHGSVHVAELALDGALFLWQQGYKNEPGTGL